MPNPDLIPVPFAQDGQKNSIQLDRVVSDPAYRATWAEGFPADTRIPKEVGGEGPDGLDFNGILNALSQAVVFLQKGNAYQFDASLAPYPIGALVRSNDNLTTYQSTIAGNSNDPNSNMTGWRVYNSSNFLVNDLTTGGTDKALTAEQGKKLNDQSFGVGQTYQLVTPSRSTDVTYTNSTGKTIFVIVRGYTTGLYIRGYVNGQLLSNYASSATRTEATIVLPVTNGSTYKIEGFSVDTWWELR